MIFQDDRIAFANHVVAEMSGYTVEDLMSFSPGEASKPIHPEDTEIVLAYVRKRPEGTPPPRCYEMRMAGKDGRVRWLETRATLTSYHGKPAIQATLIDITERKEAESQRDAILETLRESKETPRALLHASTDSALLLEPDGTIVALNETAANGIGKGKNELIGVCIF